MNYKYENQFLVAIKDEIIKGTAKVGLYISINVNVVPKSEHTGWARCFIFFTKTQKDGITFSINTEQPRSEESVSEYAEKAIEDIKKELKKDAKKGGKKDGAKK